MTRPRGTVPVKLARHRAKAMANWLLSYPLPSRGWSVLGNAGMSMEEFEADRAADLRAILDLAQILLGPKVGRPRKSVSAYYLPVRAIKLIDTQHAALAIPFKLRSVLREILRATRRKKGIKFTLEMRQRNMANGKYEPETHRRYEWIIRKEFEWLEERSRLLSGGIWLGDNVQPAKAVPNADQMAIALWGRPWLI